MVTSENEILISSGTLRSGFLLLRMEIKVLDLLINRKNNLILQQT
jgi:hypothetical protein